MGKRDSLVASPSRLGVESAVSIQVHIGEEEK